jgi:tetratricopeptide (TPR) repeat protein
MSRTRREKERAQKLWAERRELIRFGYGKLAEAIVRQARAHYQRALQAWQQGNLSEAETALRQALELNPDAPDPLIALGRLLVEMGRAEEAIGVLSKACDVDAENPEAHFWFGQALEAAQRWRRARDAYERAMRLQPSAELAEQLRERLTALEQRLAAEPTAALSEEAAAELEDALHWAQFYLEVGFPRRAREYLQRALHIAPDHPKVREVMAAIERALSD